jgi:hypothetical protein
MRQRQLQSAEHVPGIGTGKVAITTNVCAASPEAGKLPKERWFQAEDHDIRWVMRENLKKARPRRLDPAWAARWLAALEDSRASRRGAR